MPTRAPHGGHPAPRRTVPAPLIAAAVLVVTLCTACTGTTAGATGTTPGVGGGGEAGKPAARILADAQAAAQGADSVHISGTVAHGKSIDQSADTPGTARIDLVLTSSGDGRETISGAGQYIDLLKVGQVLYVQGLTGPGAAAGYQRLSVTDARAAPLLAQLDKKTVFDQLIRSGANPVVTGTAAVGGQPAVTLSPGGGSGVLYVADDPTHPYPLEVESTPTSPDTGAATPGPAGAFTFTGWNAHTVIQPPTS